MKNRTWIISLVAGLLLLQPAFGQDQGLGDMMFVAGTTRTTNSAEWAWLQWMATDSEMIKDRPVDIYMKDGEADSGNPFELKGRAMQVVDPDVIQPLLLRGELLGGNLTSLEGAVDSLYADAEPDRALTLAEKLGALIDGSLDDVDLYNNLVFMARARPAVSMAIGHGFSCQIPSSGFVTFEVRDASTEEVVGRITLEAGNPVVLPAPGSVVRVPETSPMGNLNIRLRWGIPDDLKRLSLMQFGYNLYRVEAASVTNWWGAAATPASTAELLAYVSSRDEAKKVNRMPVLVDPALTTSNTWYAVDDNDGQSGGVPFVDGVDYYYYVTALDLLGRDGDLSDPFLTFPCDRMAPRVPGNIQARAVSVYTNSANEQYMEITWDHNTNDLDVAQYYVYRFSGFSNMQASASSPSAGLLSGALVPEEGQTRMTYEDWSLTTNDWTKTYWYTVRAEDNVRCTNNLSLNSGPVYGMLRDWAGPLTPTGVVATIQVQSVDVDFERLFAHSQDPGADVELACTRPSAASTICWAEFLYLDGDGQGGAESNAQSLGRYYFSAGSTRVLKGFSLPSKQSYNFYCRVGSSTGIVSPLALHNLTLDTDGIEFKSTELFRRVPVEDAPGPHVWGKYPDLKFPEFLIPAVPGAETCRLYRRVDRGRRTLVSQVDMDEVFGAMIVDYLGGTANGGTICYYYQLTDEHGNVGPMNEIYCFPTAPRVDLPTPILDPIDSTGAVTAAPGMSVSWFCTQPGVERFELAVAFENEEIPSTFSSLGFELYGSTSNKLPVVVGGVTNELMFGFYRTGRVGTTFGAAGSPLFSLGNSVELDREYTIMVRAIGVTGSEGEWSNVENFRWSSVPSEGPLVPWPTRFVPTVQESLFHMGLGAEYLDDASFVNMNGVDKVGIRVGEMPANTQIAQTKVSEVHVGNTNDPKSYLYINDFTHVDTAFPCVLYRYQVTNTLYSSVSGDVVQVSPLMEDIAWGKNPNTVIYDPFVAVTRPRDSGLPWGMYLIDTQPVVSGCKYQYLLVRFDEVTWEMERVIPAGTVEVP